MFLRKSLFVLLSLIGLLFFGQNNNPRIYSDPNKYDKCGLQKSNLVFLNALAIEKDSDKKLMMIKEKMFSDTIYQRVLPKNFIIRDGLFQNEETKDSLGNLCGLKILFILNSRKKSFNLNLKENPEQKKILNLLNGADIQIWQLTLKQSLSLYGSKGYNGAIVLKVKNKKLQRQIRKMKFK